MFAMQPDQIAMCQVKGPLRGCFQKASTRRHRLGMVNLDPSSALGETIPWPLGRWSDFHPGPTPVGGDRLFMQIDHAQQVDWQH